MKVDEISQANTNDSQNNIRANPKMDHIIQPSIWVFPYMGYANNGGFIREHPTNMDDLRVPVF